MKRKVKRKIALTTALLLTISSNDIIPNNIYANESNQVSAINEVNSTSSSAVEIIEDNEVVSSSNQESLVTPITSNSVISNGVEFTYAFTTNPTAGTITGIVTSTIPSDGKIIIPDTVLGGRLGTTPYPVTHISSRAFKDVSGIKEVILPDTLKVIGSEAFLNCELTSLPTSQNLETIGTNAFTGTNLANLVIPESVKTIEQKAFENAGITGIEFQNDNVSIGQYAFKDNALGDFVLPDNMTTIDNYAFAYAGITSITLPNNLTSIGKYAFSNNNLGEIVIPSSVTTIDTNAFNNAGITKIEFEGENIEKIADYAFAENKLGEVKLPSSITKIGNRAFLNAGITSISLPDEVTSIGEYAFYNNFNGNHENYNKIKSFKIPTGVTAVPTGLFQANSELVEVEFHNNIKTIGQDAFNQTNLDKLYLPEGITSIGARAFFGGDKVQPVIVIPSTVTNISILTPFNTPTYALVNNTTSTVYLPTDAWDESWSADRLHENPADTSYCSEYYNNNFIKTTLEGSMFKKFDVKVVDLDAYDAKTKNGTSILTAPSFLTKDELIAYLNKEENTPIKEGYKFLRWDTININGGFIDLKLSTDEDDLVPYLLEDIISGVVPIFEKEIVESPIPTVDRIFVGDDSITGKGFEAGAIIEITLLDGITLTTTVNDDLTWSVSLDGFEDKFNGGETVSVTQTLGNDALTSAKVEKKVVGTITNIVDTLPIFSPEPSINKIFEGDNEITGKGTEIGAFIEITLSDGTTFTTTVKEDLTWSINLEGYEENLVVGEKIYATQLLTVKDAVISSIVEVKVIGTIGNIVDTLPIKSKEPLINKIFEGDDNITGTGYEIGAIIEITLPDGTILTTAVLDDLTWSIDINSYKSQLVKGALIYATQTQLGKDVETSERVKAAVYGLLIENVDPLPTVDPTPTPIDPPRNVIDLSRDSNDEVEEIEEIIEIIEDEIPFGTLDEFAPYIFGYEDGTIRPDNNITRAEFVTILYNIYGNNATSDLEQLSKFSDVNENAWYSNAVAYATENDLVVGYPDKTFRPNEYITRAEMASVLNQMNLAKTNTSDSTNLTDIENTWAENSIKTLVNAGVITGYEDNTFRPNNNSTRAETVILISRINNRPTGYSATNIFSDLDESTWHYHNIMNASNIAFTEDVLETKE